MNRAEQLAELEELRRRGVLNDCEFCRVQAALLDVPFTPCDLQLSQQLDQKLAEVKYYNQLAHMDAAWEEESQQYLVSMGEGDKQIPTARAGITSVVIGCLIGAFLATVAISALTADVGPDRGPEAVSKVLLSLLCPVCIPLLLIGQGLYWFFRARAYRRAYERYCDRRESLTPEQFR
jgi:hypothetical protein